MNIFKKIAPWIISALPIPGIAQKLAFKAIEKVTGSKIESKEHADEALSNMTPDQITAIKAEEHNFQIQMEEMGFKHVEELESLANQDRDSARTREIQVRDHIPAILAIFTTVALCICFVFLCYRDIPQNNHDIIIILITALTTGWVGVMAYYFGSSAGSKKASETIAQIAKAE